MKVEVGIWNKLTRMVQLLLFVAGVLAVAAWYLPLIRNNQAVRQRILQLDGQIQQEEARGKALKSQIDALRYDPKAVERIARERLGYAKPGETVIRFRPPATNSPAR